MSKCQSKNDCPAALDCIDFVCKDPCSIIQCENNEICEDGICKHNDVPFIYGIILIIGIGMFIIGITAFMFLRK